MSENKTKYEKTAIHWQLESERQAHAETKRNHASVVERLAYIERRYVDETNDLEKRLEELEDAITEYDSIHNITETHPTKNAIKQAIQNSRARKGEAMG